MAFASTYSTLVGKAHPTIKKIIDKTVGPKWQGRLVYVEQVDPSWEYDDDEGYQLFWVSATGSRSSSSDRKGTSMPFRST